MTELEVQQNLNNMIEEKQKGFEKDVVIPFIEKSVKGLTTQEEYKSFNEAITAQMKNVSESQLKLQKAFEDKIVNGANTYGNDRNFVKSQEQVINDFLKKTEAEDLHESLRKSKGKGFEIEVVKATQGLSSIGTGVIIPNRTRQEIVASPLAPFHMSDLVDRGGTSPVKDISYSREASYTDGFALTAEGAVFTDSNQTLEEVYDSMRKIATREIFTSEILRNVPRLLSYLIPRMLSKLETFKDSQILFGSNAGSPLQLRGLFLEAQAFAYTLGTMGAKVITPNVLDVIVKGTLLATNMYHKPNVVLINPIDLSDLMSDKTSAGQYVIHDNMLITDRMQLKIESHPIIPRNQLLIGAFNTAAELITLRPATIEFSEHEKFSEDKIVARIATECQMQIVQPQAFVKVTDIDAAKLAIKAV